VTDTPIFRMLSDLRRLKREAEEQGEPYAMLAYLLGLAVSEATEVRLKGRKASNEKLN